MPSRFRNFGTQAERTPSESGFCHSGRGTIFDPLTSARLQLEYAESFDLLTLDWGWELNLERRHEADRQIGICLNDGGAASLSSKAVARANREPERFANSRMTNQPEAAVFNFDKARIFTRMLAGLAAPLTISPVAGLRTKVPALRAGTLRRVTFNKPGKVNSPTPRGCTDPSNTLSSVAKTPTAVLRGMSFCSAIRLMSAALVKVSLTGRMGAASRLTVFDLLTFALAKGTLLATIGFLDADGTDNYALAFAGRPRLLGAAVLAFLTGAAFVRI